MYRERDTTVLAAAAHSVICGSITGRSHGAAAGSNFPAAEIARRESQLITDGVADCRLICELISAVQRGCVVTYCYLAPVRELVEASVRAQVSLVWEGGHIL